MKYKLLTVLDKDLVKELDSQSKTGFEVVEFLEKVNPSASSDFVGWRILLRNK